MKRLHRRSAREAARRFVVEGPPAVREALAYGGLLELFACDPDHPLVAQARAAGTEVVLVTEAVLAAMAETVTPQGLVGIAPLRGGALSDVRGRLVVVLEDVRDPGNAGTVIRTADAVGADAVVLTADSVDPHNGKCVRATAGSLFHLPVVAGPTTAQAVAAARAAGLQVLATSGAGEDDLDELAAGDVLNAPTLWLLGNEAAGLSDEALSLADRRVRIPIHGLAESLNLATAAAVCLYASARAQHAIRASSP